MQVQTSVTVWKSVSMLRGNGADRSRMLPDPCTDLMVPNPLTIILKLLCKLLECKETETLPVRVLLPSATASIDSSSYNTGKLALFS